MDTIAKRLEAIRAELLPGVSLVAVSKTKPVEMIQEAYEAGQRIFGENRAQEMAAKFAALPNEIEWHMIGHLQTNKVKYIAPFVSLIHSVDSESLLEAIQKEAQKNNRVIACLIQVYIATEESKHGFLPEQVLPLLEASSRNRFPNVAIQGLMGMASFTEDDQLIRREFSGLAKLYREVKASSGLPLPILSMGMSGDYRIAMEEGSTMVRIGSSIFGSRS